MGWWDSFVDGIGDVFADLEDEFGEDEEDLDADDYAEELLAVSIEDLANPEHYGE